mgnify:CR=1 FL=1
MSGRRAGCPGLREGPDVRARGWMSGLTAIASVGSGAWHRISGHLAGCPGWGRMSGAWKVNLPVSVGSLHPWTWRLVRLHGHLREGPLDT